MQATFGRYELLQRLAAGGMGEVYLARLRGIAGFEKLVVVKTLLPHLCEDAEFIAMFKDEARICAQLVHPNIGQVFELDQAAGVFYMAMEYLHGEDLRRLWRACESARRPLPLPMICRIAADAAAGLDFAHSLRDPSGRPYGIVHRDVSPQNIVVTFEGGVKVIDFGVAKAAGRAQHTRTGALKGKAGYMSPEQVSGAPVDRRSDVFALGIVLHELLTGARLFQADSDVQTLWRVRACEVPRPSSVNAAIPASLDPVVMQALRRDPKDRYESAQELRLAIEEWLAAQRLPASAAHLAEFLKEIYAERLALEARHGPLRGEAPLSGAAPTVETEGPQKRHWTMGAATALAAAAAASASVAVLRPASQSAVERSAVVAHASIVPAPSAPSAAPSKKRTFAVRIDVVPSGASIYDGARRIPPEWSDAEEGEHELRVEREGYLPQKRVVRVTKEGEAFRFRLRRRPALDIKVER